MRVWLTKREFEVYHGLLRESGHRSIGAQLRISTKTVHFHVNNIYRKLGVSSWREFLAFFGHFETRLVWVANKNIPKVCVLNQRRRVK